MTDPTPTSRLNAALVDRYRIERQLGEGGMAGKAVGRLAVALATSADRVPELATGTAPSIASRRRAMTREPRVYPREDS